jgi:hypothetical protein
MSASRNYWVDVAMALIATVLAVSSFLLWVVLPQGYFRGRLMWLEIHKWSGLAVTVMVLVHLVLHRRWLWAMTRRKLGAHVDTEARGRQP